MPQIPTDVSNSHWLLFFLGGPLWIEKQPSFCEWKTARYQRISQRQGHFGNSGNSLWGPRETLPSSSSASSSRPMLCRGIFCALLDANHACDFLIIIEINSFHQPSFSPNNDFIYFFFQKLNGAIRIIRSILLWILIKLFKINQVDFLLK